MLALGVSLVPAFAQQPAGSDGPLVANAEADGYAIVPLKVYFDNNGRVKIQIALGKGKKLYDKRETLKKRTVERNELRYVK